MMTYIPCSGIYNSYYGYRFYSPQTVGALYYVSRLPRSPHFMGGGGVSVLRDERGHVRGNIRDDCGEQPGLDDLEQRVERSYFQEQRRCRWTDAVRSARLGLQMPLEEGGHRVQHVLPCPGL